MEMIIYRTTNEEKQRLGKGFLVKENGDVPFAFYTLELADKDNKRSISYIPAGVYRVVKRRSIRFGEHFHVQNVPNRELILIHVGNSYRNTNGCILVGTGLKNIDNDETTDVINSIEAMRYLLTLLPDSFFLKIF